MIRFPLHCAFLILMISSLSIAHAQTTVTLGNPDFTTEDFNGIHGPYSYENTSSKAQMLVPANALSGAGLTQGLILSFAFNVQDAFGGTLQDFRVAMGPSDGDFGFQFENGLEEVIAAADYEPAVGWNTHTLETPYFWDGISDIVIETCYTNDNNNNGSPHVVFFSFGGGGAGQVYKESDTMGNGSSCDDNNSEDQFFARPHMQVTWAPPEFPPVAGINVLSVSECGGTVFLEDVSQWEPSSWLWYFGDGSTSTDENPSHTYLANGSYDISLVVTNDFGTDSITLNNAAVINLAANPPIPASCFPQTMDQNAGFGVINVSLNGSNYASSNGEVGYEDLTCSEFTLDEGASFILEVDVTGPADNFVVAWIDYDNSGSFTEDEQIMSQISSGTASAEFTVPTGTVTDTPLRMRVMSDFFQLGEPGPCTDPSGGQAEDHTVFINANTLAPTASFNFSPSLSCDGEIQFTDESVNAPETWLWQFGDGEFGSAQNPIHTYMESGTYSVTLLVSNSFGQDDTLMTDIIVIDLESALVPACTPETQSYCCGYGIIDMQFHDISNSSDNGVAGYEDFSCQIETGVTEGESYPISIDTGDENPQDVHLFVDFNNDGDFSGDELLYSSFNSEMHTGMVEIPVGQATLETRLRLRAIADFVGNGNTGCVEPQFGQVEDYSIVIYPDTTPPTAQFSPNATLSCDGIVSFTNQSLLADSYVWNFGDGNSTTDENPTHTYAAEGTYTVQLIATNDYGVDSLTLEDLITIDFEGICDTLTIPSSGVDPVITDCNGFLADDGGPNEVYSNDANGTRTIETTAGNFIRLEFIEFNYQTNNDFLIIYDGPDSNAPSIGTFTGNSLPNGGVIESSGTSITLVHVTNFFGQNDGFILEWSCLPVGLDELSESAISIFPNPASTSIALNYQESILVDELWITDLLGQEVMRVSRPGWQVDISDLRAGQYIIRLETSQGRSTKRLTVR